MVCCAMYYCMCYHTDVAGVKLGSQTFKMTFQLGLADKYFIVSGVDKDRSSLTLGSVT